jgi:L-threonylcarbamoyladenylate synthase
MKTVRTFSGTEYASNVCGTEAKATISGHAPHRKERIESSLKTKLLQENEIAEAAALIRAGEAVGMPTETVYGLACDAGNPDAVRKVFAAKGRPADNPLIVHIADLADWQPLVTEIPPLAQKLAERFWPGPLTIILPRTERVPAITAGGLDSVGVRFPAHPVAQAFIKAAGVPIAAPSGNRSGSPSPTTSAHMMADMDGRIPAIIEGGSCFCGVESTVIVLDDAETVRVLRPGFVTPEQLGTVAKNVIVDPAVLAQISADTVVRSPGMKYKHYAPNAQVTLVQGGQAEFLSFMREHNAEGSAALVFDADLSLCEEQGIRCRAYGDTDEERAAAFFAALRDADAAGVQHLYVRAPRTDGVGLAVYNRLIRAAGYDIVNAEGQ